MFGNRCDVKLIDRGSLFFALRAPIGSRAAKQRCLRMSLWNFCRRIIEEQIFRQLALLLGDGGVSLDAFGIDDGEIQACFGAVVKEYRIDHFARSGREAERDIRNSKYRAHVRNPLLDRAYAFDSLDSSADIVFIPGGAGKNERVEDDVFDSNAVFFGEQVGRAFSDFELSFTRERLRLHGIFVNAADDEGGAIRARQRANTFEFFLAVFEIDRIDDALSLAIGKRQFDGTRIGAVDHHRNFDFANQLVIEGRNIFHLVTVGALQADVHDVRAAFYLTPRDFRGF